MIEQGNGQGSYSAPKPSRLDLWRAERKLQRARAALDANRTAWAWFAAHEAAELAARSIHRNGNARERMVARLLIHAAEHVPVPEELVRKAALLDNHYIPHQNGHVLTPPQYSPTLNGNGHAPGHANGNGSHAAPPMVFGNPDAPASSIAVQTAEEIVAFARSTLRRNRP